MKTKELAKKVFGASNIKGLAEINYTFKPKYKIAVFVPIAKTDELTFAMAAAGAGMIGNYTVCSYRTMGTGTFLGNRSSKPFAGNKNKFEMVEEVRLEMICDEEYLNDVIDCIYEIHPYDEPAHEIYPVMVRDKKPNDKVIAVSLKKKLTLRRIIT